MPGTEKLLQNKRRAREAGKPEVWVMDEISKKDLLLETGISYGQLYRWKREGLIPEEWFVKRASFTGQETFFPRERALERVRAILEMKEGQSLEEIRGRIAGDADGELDALTAEAISAAARDGAATSAVLFETNDGKHFVLYTKDGRAITDGGVRTLLVLSEKEVKERVKALGTGGENGGKAGGK
jgi:DNA-binding transcriptional MerR regulator